MSTAHTMSPEAMVVYRPTAKRREAPEKQALERRERAWQVARHAVEFLREDLGATQVMSAEITGVRPAVLSAETRHRLDRYRGLRHVVRDVYTYNLDVEEQINILARQLPDTMSRVSDELLAFAVFFEQCSS